MAAGRLTRLHPEILPPAIMDEGGGTLVTRNGFPKIHLHLPIQILTRTLVHLGGAPDAVKCPVKNITPKSQSSEILIAWEGPVAAHYNKVTSINGPNKVQAMS